MYLKTTLSSLPRCLLLLTLYFPALAFADGNQSIESFSSAKRLLLQQVYIEPAMRSTLYCQASFDEKKNVRLNAGFSTSKYLNRLARYETEHVVPAENFGRSFSEWREGHSSCVNSKGKPYKGRRCAEKANSEYRLMQADMYNLYPAIGAVNAARSNYNFTMLSDSASSFGSCDMRIESRKAQPPEIARGPIARSYLYMDVTYKRFSMSSSQRKLMHAWDKQYPVTQHECLRAERIEKVQQNRNAILHERCLAMK
ncbi:MULTISPECIES: endonuclease [unclassified Agarivorans]|uniref:endonuclease n=1 Tax=unclassified Agarivorans TaxID=2636026 RepID=UPI0026E2FADB|nr:MULTISPECIES: endonuclease [unclassified Agarivorans]MDO6685751.1 endonuclease [Agarivorans sp. 3_MG-2023]MDO6716134.1 endonuclease [Agarivorans sp. 2_MG-2023]